MKKLTTMLVALLLLGGAISCTDNQRARAFGGTTTEILPAGEKLVNATWKQDDLWLVTRPMRPDEKPESYTFRERSSFGILEGTVVIKEMR